MKPARLQLDPSTINDSSKPEQTGQIFNVWYSKWTGGETNGRAGLVHAKTRCHVTKDSGYTKADRHVKPGGLNRDKYFCVYFARGCCCNGKRCEYLHRIPTEMDQLPPTVDCFGREKYMDYREDMSGVGSFNKVNRTLYIGRINSMDGNIELKLGKSFGEFGDIERIRIVKSKKIAFITYRLENQAQFAKEAMYGQGLGEDENETLNIRWANEDPDPNARKRKREEEDRAGIESAKRLLKELAAERASEVSEEVSEVEDEHEDEPTEVSTATPRPAIMPKPIISTDSLGLLLKLKEKRKVLREEREKSKGLELGYSSEDE
ncbi:DEKNAAC104297 [Brettanomyces naardenensis]|uniref:Pre-mRNA-splicing factor CWC2 n=1 Tax=Brettanomyces naardenensis TaxID=13370 RepID=A0A448YPP8_BRENA|nr:DEKNAAC104297 [Brettanomyces naardenensis]